MNSGGVPFSEMGEISIEENEWSEEVSRKHEGTLRQDERYEEVSLVGTKMKLGTSWNSSGNSFSWRDGLSIMSESKSELDYEEELE